MSVYGGSGAKADVVYEAIAASAEFFVDLAQI